MKKSISSIGTALEKSEQKKVFGGDPPFFSFCEVTCPGASRGTPCTDSVHGCPAVCDGNGGWELL